MRKWLNAYFDFTKSEFNGLLVLCFLILLCFAMPYVFRCLAPEQPERPSVRIALKKLELRQIAGQRNPKRLWKDYNPWKGSREDFKKQFIPGDFDPNKLDVAGWQKLGLSERQAEAVVRYRAKGGSFNSKADVKKMYTISPEVYSRLEPFIKIESTEAAGRYRQKEKLSEKVPEVYDINTADTLQLQEIRGIGPAFARRIAKYRDRLGGFYSLDQLLEVYGLDSQKLAEIKGQIRLGQGALRQINVNTADFDVLKNHPYLKYKQINAIIQYRKQHGNYSSFADLKKVAILPPETVGRMAPYLSF